MMRLHAARRGIQQICRKICNTSEYYFTANNFRLQNHAQHTQYSPLHHKYITRTRKLEEHEDIQTFQKPTNLTCIHITKSKIYNPSPKKEKRKEKHNIAYYNHHTGSFIYIYISKTSILLYHCKCIFVYSVHNTYTTVHFTTLKNVFIFHHIIQHKCCIFIVFIHAHMMKVK
jgi:hypothetical protein